MSLEGDAPESGQDEVLEPVEGVEEQPQPEAPPSLEDVAERMGWTPQDRWKGDPEKWRPAHDYVRKTADINQGLSTRLKGLEDELGRMSRTSAQITEQALASQRDRLENERKEAFEVGDHKAYEKADEALRVLPATVVEPSVPQETKAFMERNASWFQKDQGATQYALSRAQFYTDQGLPAAKQLESVESDMKRFFPELFPQEQRTPAKAAPLNSPGARSAPVKKGFATLPDDAKKVAMEYKDRGVIKDVEEYARIYYEDEA